MSERERSGAGRFGVGGGVQALPRPELIEQPKPKTDEPHVCTATWCPVCQVVGLVRDNPDAIAQVSASAAAFAKSLRDLVDSADAIAKDEERMTYAIGVDIGGTKIAAGLVSEAGELLKRESEPTPDDSTKIPAIVADLAERLAGDEKIVGIGIGAAGFTSTDRTTVRFAPNINWIDEPLAEQVAALVDLPVVVENDANAAAWGEFTFGAGEDTDDLLLVTVGTGVGGGIVHHGQLYRGGFGIAAEIGHMRIVPNGIECGCGEHGCFEQYASGSALVRVARERVANGDRGTEALKALGRRRPQQASPARPHRSGSRRRRAVDRAAGRASVDGSARVSRSSPRSSIRG